MATINAWGSQDPAEETKGGTAKNTYTTGDILYSDSANSLAKRGIGATNEVLAVVGGVPDWVSLPIQGDHDWNLITTSSPVSGTSVEVTSGLGTAYEDYMIVLNDVSSSAKAILDVGFSDDGGSTYAVSLVGQRYREAYSTTPFTRFSGSDIDLSVDGTPNLYFSYIYWSGNKNGHYKMAQLQTDEDGPDGWSYNYFGVLTTTNDIDAVQFTISAGTFDGGTFYFYGR